ncbi:MAG: carboxylesterase [Pseudomonadales bacterium]|nr:carboxylesterase [Pseudomonadales bacterium]RLU04132.1 MAG: carboxylesterase/lipase family protein [Ketobacter sp.]
MTVSVNTPCGEIIGLQREGYQEFRGIPYAEQPIGVSRFKAPEPLLPFDEPFKADRFGDSAPQDHIPLFGITQTSEDCLYLNVWTPSCDDKKRPVMVWIHGGGFLTGSGSQLIYNGRNLAVNGDVVVVSINYRLGVLGYLYFNDLIHEDHNISANNGLLDQIEALRWVKNNIAAFGGDPEDVTLFGESAGGMSIATLLASPAAKGLFKRAIIQSGGADQVLTRSEATEIARKFLEITEIDPANPEKLWQLSPDQIVKAQRKLTKLSFNRGAFSQEVRQTGMVLLPVVEGCILPQTPLSAIQQGEAKDIPIMVGCTRDEWNLFLNLPGTEGLFAPGNVNEVEKSDLIALLEKSVPGMGERAANLYEKLVQKAKETSTLADIYSAFEGDRMFRIPTLRIAEAHSEHNRNAFVFQFNWDKGGFGACHASDIPLIFGCTDNPAGQFLCGTDPGAAKLSTIVQNCWIAFARSSDPSTDGVGKWHAFDDENRHVMCFGENSQLHPDPFADSAPLWEGVL